MNELPTVPVPARGAPRCCRLLVAATGEWFQVNDGRRIDIATRRPLRRLLVTLAEARSREDDRVVDVWAAFAGGWPGERALARAAALRVYTAINTLRRLGLDGVLVRRTGGYILDARVQLVGPAPTALPELAAAG